MKNLKNGFSNKIIIHQMPLFERIMGVLSAIVLTMLPILGVLIPLYKDEKELGLMIVLLAAMLIYSIFMFFSVFKTYICLDAKNQKIIIRESPGLKKEELSLMHLIDLKITDGPQYKELFTIDINYMGYTKKIISWSAPPSSRLVMFNRYKRQIKRLKKFTVKCNNYLKNN